MTVRTYSIPDTNADTPLSDCLNQITITLFKNAFSFEKGVRKGDADSIHAMRRAAIRLFSVLDAFSPCFKKNGFKKNFPMVKKLLKRLGEVRKADVFREVLEKFYQNPKDIRPLISKFSLERSIAQKRLKNFIVKFKKKDYKKRYYIFSNKPLVSNSIFRIEMPLRESFESIFPQTADEMVSNLKNAIKSPALVKELHKTRIKAKPLKAISEISVSLFDNKFKSCLGEIKEVLSVMGEIHDLDETVIQIEKNHNKKWFKRLQPGLEHIRGHRYALFEKLCEITDSLQKSDFVKRISVTIESKSKTNRGGSQ